MPRTDREVARDFLEGDPLLLAAEVAEAFRVNVATVGRWVLHGRFPELTAAGRPAVIRLPGNQYRIRASVVRGLVNGTIPWESTDGEHD